MIVPTWLEVILSLEEAWYGRRALAEAVSTLRRLSESPVARNLGNESPVRQIDFMNELLFSHMGLCFRKNGSNDNFALIPTLRDRSGNCLGLVTAYVSLAAALALPVRPRLFDGHIAVVHLGGPEPIYIETSRSGAVVATPLVRRLYGGDLGRDLSEDEFMAVHLSNRAAFVLAPAGQVEAALGLLDVALTLFPNYGSAWVNRAALLLCQGRTSEASAALARVHRGTLRSKTTLVVTEMTEAIISGGLRSVSNQPPQINKRALYE